MLRGQRRQSHFSRWRAKKTIEGRRRDVESRCNNGCRRNDCLKIRLKRWVGSGREAGGRGVGLKGETPGKCVLASQAIRNRAHAGLEMTLPGGRIGVTEVRKGTSMTTRTHLNALGIRTAKWPHELTSAPGVFCTAGNQILGSFKDLAFFSDRNPAYKGWHRHHIVESRDLKRLGVTDRLPEYCEQLCVLLPPSAHAVRINSVLQRQNPNDVRASAADLRGAYVLAYSMMGDYCGGGKSLIRKELMSIVRGQFREAGIS
jgi:hypothetical protein